MNRESIQLNAQIIAKDTQELYDLAISKGIQLPHPSLGIFRSILAEVFQANGNGIRLGEKATEAAVSTLIGCQINRNHLRADNVLGHIIDAKINKDKEIEIACIFFKDIYKDEWENAQELFVKNKLTMSFELSADVESQEKLQDGTKILNDYYFTGAGLLFGVKPACKKARVFEMAAKKLQERLSMERQSLIFANNQNSQKSVLEVLKLMADEVKKIEETVVAEAPKVEEPKAEEAKVEEPKAEEVKVEETATVTPEAPKVEEAKIEEPKAEDAPKVESKAEEQKVEAQPIEVPKETVVVTETKQVVTDTMKENSETIKVETETVRKVDDQVNEERKEVVEVTYTYAQMEEVKAGYEKQIVELKEQIVSKEKEVETLKAAQVKEEKVEAKVEEPVVLATGHKKIEASDSSVSPIAKILKNKKSYRK